MKIGCFALVEPFAPLERQFQLIREMGIYFADITDNHNGGMLGVEYGFAASVSLDSRARKIRALAERAAKGFAFWTQFVAMTFCQLAHADSLREICNGLACSEGKLVHLGITNA